MVEIKEKHENKWDEIVRNSIEKQLKYLTNMGLSSLFLRDIDLFR